ncbi:hypothetical protein REPUB_Repub06bG0092500 [Reevesia pubescens]
MDFHSLARKELQTLCKRNKIPANITNVAMADALKALEIVEGLEEFMDQSQSPEKTMNKSSQGIPSTVSRTSTRRKTTKEEPQSTQSTTRTRRTTRRTMESSEENNNVNVPEIPVMSTTTRRRAQKTEPKPEVKEHKNSDLLETPASQSGRRRPGVGSNRRKVEAQKDEGSVQQGYGTRRSVRLVEMGWLTLKESEKMEPVKIVEMVEGEADNMNAQFGATSEVPLARNLSASLEDERDLKYDILENSKCHNGENDSTLISEDDSHRFDNLDGLAFYTKDATPNEKTDEPEGEGELADIPDGIISPKGSDDVAVSEDSYEIVNLNNKLVADEINDVSKESYDIVNLNEELVAETKLIDVSVAAFEDISEAEFMGTIEVVSVEEYANNAPQDLECQKLVGKDCDIDAVHDDLAKLPEAEEYDQGKVSQNVSVLPKDHMDSSEKMGNDESDDEPDEIVPASNIVDAFLGDSDINDDTGSNNNSFADELMTNMVDEEALVDESSFHNASQSVVDDIPVHKNGDAEGLVGVCAMPAEEFAETAQEIPPEEKSPPAAKLKSPCASLTSNSAITTSIQLSPMTAQFSQPTRFTPRKSSSKKQTTIQKVTQVSDNINKENIEHNSMKELEPGLGKVKKNKNILDEETMQNLEGMSLRNLKKLTKMFDELQITDNTKNKENKNFSKQPFGKSRPALQTLPQNCMRTAEAEKQN